MTDALLKALVSVVAMLEDAAKFGMDSHAAVNSLESVAFELDQMDDSERVAFTEAINRVADSADPARREWIRSLPRNLGI
ncbi:hypothetical protein [Streptomyces sp. NPDC057257]|uniref:hypothetical protein n=1 Tax=Streptomyces sp. NPDC057257 TaxID=3346071 RepID=UPI003633E50A